jgi:hypothetical protein
MVKSKQRLEHLLSREKYSLSEMAEYADESPTDLTAVRCVVKDPAERL